MNELEIIILVVVSVSVLWCGLIAIGNATIKHDIKHGYRLPRVPARPVIYSYEETEKLQDMNHVD